MGDVNGLLFPRVSMIIIFLLRFFLVLEGIKQKILILSIYKLCGNNS